MARARGRRGGPAAETSAASTGEGLLATELHVSMPFVVFRNKATVPQVARDVGFWALVYLGNALGTLFVAYLLSASQTFHGESMERLTAKVMEGLRYEALGFQHLTSSMAFFHTGILSGVPVGYGEIVAWNLAPVTLGNVIGGAVFVGFLYRYTHVVEARGGRRGVAR